MQPPAVLAHADPYADLERMVQTQQKQPQPPAAVSSSSLGHQPSAQSVGDGGKKKSRGKRGKKGGGGGGGAAAAPAVRGGDREAARHRAVDLDDDEAELAAALLDPSSAPAGRGGAIPLHLDIREEDATPVDDDDEDGGGSKHGTEEDFSDTQNERAREYRPGGYHPVRVAEVYNERYRVAHKLGWGYFSTVWLVWDYTTEGFYAMKVQKSAQQYYDAAFDEIKLLSEINTAAEVRASEATPTASSTSRSKSPLDASGSCHCARLYDYFEHKGPNGNHVCMVFEVLGENLLKLIERYDYKGIPIPIVKSIAQQTLQGLAHIHSIDIIHTDLKPENVLLSHPKHKIVCLMRKYKAPAIGERPSLLSRDVTTMTKSQRRRYRTKLRKLRAAGKPLPDDAHPPSPGGGSNSGKKQSTAAADAPGEDEDSETDDEWEVDRIRQVCLADFGNSCWTHRQFTDEVQTRQYRSPEVIIGNGYGTAIDVWSAACMFFELLTGEFLFDPKQQDDYSRDEDHLALMMELMGEFPEDMTMPGAHEGKFRREYFNSDGQLRHIHQLKYWPLADVLQQKYRFSKKKAKEIAEFLLPMLTIDPQLRATADEMLCSSTAKFFEIQDDDYAPFCFKAADEAKSDDDDDEGRDDDEEPAAEEDDVNAWLDDHPMLRPEALELRGLTIFDVKATLAGDDDVDEETARKVQELIHEMSSQAKRNHGDDDPRRDDATSSSSNDDADDES